MGASVGDPNIDAIQTWLRQVKGDPALSSASTKRKAPVDAYGVFWKMSIAKLKQLHDRDHIQDFTVSYIKLNGWQGALANGATPENHLQNTLLDELKLHTNVGLEQARLWIVAPNAVLWLLDGLDEIRSPQARQALVHGVETLAHTRPQDSFIITVRPSGYLQPLGGMWQDCELLRLNDAQVSQVLEKWQAISDKNNDTTIDAAAINRDLAPNTALNQLRRNPLLLCCFTAPAGACFATAASFITMPIKTCAFKSPVCEPVKAITLIGQRCGSSTS
jgi:hypothetical protein